MSTSGPDGHAAASPAARPAGAGEFSAGGRSAGAGEFSATGRSAGAGEFSAGGVVVRGDEMIVIVPVKRAADGRRVLGLPKGHLDGDETPAQAAAREVAEETGVRAKLVDELGDVRYRYERKGRQVDKVVRFYLFTYCSGDVADHDHEIEEARWVTLSEAALELTYAGEREMVKRALSRFAQDR